MKKAKRKQVKRHQKAIEKAIVKTAWRNLFVKAGVVK